MSSTSQPLPARLRMAPSPTGEYHIGHIRTVLYNWAYAQKTQGQFVIRIEDTDRVRLVEGATERILEVIKDYGLSWNEGPDIGGPYAPYVQSERLPIYSEYIQQLIEKKSAYHCFCSEERLTKMREEQKARGVQSTKYDRHCLNLSEDEVKQKIAHNESYVIRLKMPENRLIELDDVVYGKIQINSNTLDDQVLMKSDGFPTYHFAVVVDDHLMKITHVMRGNDWLPSTPKHVLLYEAFGWEMPVHIHLPNLKELGGVKKLSKRYGAVFAREFLDEGYLPEALLNFLMFLGWNPGGEKELYSVSEFVEAFDINKIHKTDLVAFDRKKLEWYNAQYIKLKNDEELAKLLVKFAPSGADEQILTPIAALIKDRIKKLSEFETIAEFFFKKPISEKNLFTSNAKNHLSTAIKVLEESETLTNDQLNTSIMDALKSQSFKTGDFFMDLRIAIAGQKISPPINESMVILGKQESLERLNAALAILAS